METEVLIGIVLVVAIFSLVGYFMFLASREHAPRGASADEPGAAQIGAAALASARVSQAPSAEEVYYPQQRENEIPLDMMVSYLFNIINEGESDQMRRKLREQGCYYKPLDRTEPMKDFSMNISVDLGDGKKVDLEGISDLFSRWGKQMLSDPAIVAPKSEKPSAEEQEQAFREEADGFRKEMESEGAQEPVDENPSAAAEEKPVGGGAYSSTPSGFVMPPAAAAPLEPECKEEQAPQETPPPSASPTQSELEAAMDDDADAASDDGGRRSALVDVVAPPAPKEGQEESKEQPSSPESVFMDSGSVIMQEHVEPVPEVNLGRLYSDSDVLSDEGLQLYAETVMEIQVNMDAERFPERKEDAEVPSESADESSAEEGKEVEIDEQTGMPVDVLDILRNPPLGLLGLCLYVNHRFNVGIDYDSYDLGGTIDQIGKVKRFCRGRTLEDICEYIRLSHSLFLGMEEVKRNAAKPVEIPVPSAPSGGVREVEFSL